MFEKYHPANLGDDRLDEVKSLEAELGKVVLALEPDLPVASLDEQQVARVKEVEKKLGVVIVAFDD